MALLSQKGSDILGSPSCKLPSSAEEGWPKAGVVLFRNRFARTAPPRLRGLPLLG